MRCHLMRLQSAPLTSYRMAKFGWAPFADRRMCEAWRWGRMQNLWRKVKWRSHGTKFTKFWDDIADPLYFQTPISDCLSLVSFRRYSPLSVEVIKNRTNVKVILAPQFLGGTTPIFLRPIVSAIELVSAIYCLPFGKVWLSSVCWTPSPKPGNEVESKIYGVWAKMQVQF